MLDKLKLDEEVEANVEEVTKEVIKRYKTLREKNDPGVFVLPICLEAKIDSFTLADTGSNINVLLYHIYTKPGREEAKPLGKKITMLDYSKAQPMGILRDVVCQVGVTTILAKILIVDIPVDKDVSIVIGRKKVGEEEEEYFVKRDKNGKSFYGPATSKYLNCDDPLDRALALQEALNPFKKIGIWKKMVAFLGSLPVPLQHMEWILSYSDNAFDDLDADLAHGMEYMDTEEAVNKKGGSTVSTVRPERVSTAGVTINTADPEISVVEPRTPPTTASIFDDEDVTMAQTLIKMKEEKAKEKGVAFKDVEDSSRPARSILTLKPLPIIDPKDKGKGVLQEPEPAKKMAKSDFDAAQIARDAEIARQLEVDWQAEEERKRQREEEASKAAIAEMYDEVQAGIDADALFAAKLQQEEREEYTIEERAKFLAETIAAQRKFRAAQRSAEIRSMYERQKKYVQDFVPIGSAEEEKLIKKMNEKATGEDTSNKEKVLEELDNSDLEEEEQLKAFLMIVPDEEGEINYEVLNRRVFRANGSSRYIKTFTKMVSRFDRLDFIELHSLVMKRFEISTPEGIDLILWGMLEDGTKFYMLAERKYPFTKETLKRMLALRLIAKSKSEAVFDLLRFIQQQIDESGSHDGSEKDL
ncbi:hypothetical protein Tco_0527537 [Tanacetum coccineum]